MPTRSRKQEKAYTRHKKKLSKNSCDFCDIDKTFQQHVRDTKSFKLFRNIFPYSVWDDQEVAEHLLLSPKRHIDTLDDLKPQEAIEFVHLVAEYENKGYNVYMRPPQSKVKTVSHQHTHLIKPRTKTHNLLFVLRKPYIRIAK